MVLNSIFPRQGLLDDIGLLKPRWAQDGSAIVNVVGNNVTQEVIHTVTAGKRLFVTGLTFLAVDNPLQQFELRDGPAVGGRKYLSYALVEDDPQVVVFDTPLFFDTSVYVETNIGEDFDVSIQGWEENA